MNTAHENQYLNRKINQSPRNLKELAEMVERMKAEAPQIKRDKTAVVVSAEEYWELRKSGKLQG